jgi:hypothetical protein
MVELPRIKPFTAIAVEGAVLIDAGGVALTMTPEAASASAGDLMAAASLAQRQAKALGSYQAPHSDPSSSGPNVRALEDGQGN